MPTRALLAIVAIALLGATAAAERLPVHVYTTADGLANGRVIDGTQDARGFLWFATIDGLSRFDGDDFESFGTGDGLPDPSCHDVLATRDGAVWVATDRGLARLDPDEPGVRPRFAAVPLATAGGDDTAFTMFEDNEHLWVGTSSGLERIDGERAEAIPLEPGHEPFVFAIAEDGDHTLWLGTSNGLYRRLPDGTVTHARFTPAGTADDRTTTLLVDHAGRLWVGAANLGLVALVPPPATAPIATGSLWESGGAGLDADGRVRLPRVPGEIVRYTEADGFPAGGVRRLIFEDTHGTLWFGGLALVRLRDGHFDTIGARQGFPPEDFAPCLEDSDGNLWFGANTQGVVRLTSRAIVSYDDRDGLSNLHVLGVTEDVDGALVAITGGHVLNRFDGDRFTSVMPAMPASVPEVRAWGWNQIDFVDRDGRWWYATASGLAHFPAGTRFADLATTPPTFFTTADGLPGRDVYRLYQDRVGDVWITTLSGAGLARWDRATDRIVAAGDGLPRSIANAFAEDATGTLWIGYDSGELARLPGRDPAAAQVLTVGDRAIEALLVDRDGRLWIATDAGVVRIGDPSAAAPTMVRYTTREGLATDHAMELVDDLRGRVYVGSVRGLDRIDPASGEIAHLSTADGMPDDYVMSELRDRDGAIWVGTQSGLARIVPEDPPSRPAPVAYLVALTAGGVARPLAMGGATGASEISLGYDEAQLDLAFTSPSFATGTAVRFQTRLEGAEDAWTAPSDVREVHYAHLAPGHYRFEVRALVGGVPSAPTGVDVEIRAPFWRRPWFLALVFAGVIAVAFRLYRMRVARLVEIERVRTRIATDLHDDLGSSLSRISILAEVAARTHDAETVADIGRSARALVDVAADIVWSTDPHRDDLGSLLVRLRSFAGDVLDGKGIAWTLAAPPAPEHVRLGPDERRHLYLVLKEAINNTARHSGATTVEIAVVVVGHELRATVRDDGAGLDPARVGGNGLGNMRARARQAGGSCTIATVPGGGTRVTLRIPLGA